MKFTKIRLIGLATIDLPIVGALPSDEYILKSADGLGPPGVDVTIAATPNTGGVYQGRRPQSREPVLTIGLNPDFGSGKTAGDLRTALYGLLTPGYSDIVELQIMDGSTVVATTSGYIKKLEPSPFTNEPEVQLTMACLQSYLEAPNDLYVAPGGTLSAPEINNVGTARTGFHMEINFTAALSSWTLWDAQNIDKMEFDYDFISGDKLAFDTRPGSRGVWLTRDLVTSSILYAWNPSSTWFTLYGGNNAFNTSSPDFNWGDVYYRPKYWGI